MAQLILTEEGATPTPPASGQISLYAKTDGVVYVENSSGVETPIGTSNSITALTGDVTAVGPGSAVATVVFVGGQTATNVAAAVVVVEGATSSNVVNTLVERDGAGNFAAGTITASLNGNASTASSAVSAISFTGPLAGDITGHQSTTVVSLVGGQTASAVAAAAVAVAAATPINMASTLVERDASGNFAANIITAALVGNVTGNVSGSSTSFTGPLVGDVTGTQGATVVSAIQGTSISTTPPSDAQLLIYNSGTSKWVPVSMSGDASITDSGAITLSTTAVTGKLLTGYAAGVNTPINATNSILTALENLQAQISGTTGTAITALTGDVTAVGPGSAVATVAAIQGNTVSGTTGTGNVVFSASPTLTGTITAAAANFSGAISASNFSGSSSGTNTGNVTVVNTNSIDLAFSAGQTGLSANLNLSAAGPDAGYIPALSQIESDGLLVEVLAGAPVQIGTTNSVGSAASASRSDHVHAITSPIVLGLLLTGYTAGSNTPLTAANTLLQGFENLQAQISASTGAAITSLTGDVSATGPGAAAATVNSVGGKTASDIAAATATVDAATSADTPSTLVKRDGSGNFSAGVITAALVGNASTATTATNFTGSLSGDVTGGQSTTKVVAIQGKTVSNVAPTDAQVLIYNNGSAQYNPESFSGDVSLTNAGVTTVLTVGGSTAANIHSAELAANAATNLDTPSTIVKRDASGNFSAGTITSALIGNVTGNVSGTASNVTGIVAIANGGTGSATQNFVDLTTNQTVAGTKTFSSPTVISNASVDALVINTSAFIFDSLNNALGIGIQPLTTVTIDAINTSGASKAVQLTGYGVGSTLPFRGRFARGTVGTPAAVQAGDTLAVFSGRGYGASQFAAASTGAVNVVANETFTNTSNQTYVQVLVTPTGSVTAVEHMRVSATGVTLGAPSASTDLHTINGGQIRTNKTITANYTVDSVTTDDIIYCNQSAAITITLPTPTSGRTIVVKDTSGNAQINTITIAPHASEKIEGLSASKVLYTNFGGWTFTADATGNWWMI